MLGPKEVHEMYVSRFEEAVLEHVLSNGVYVSKKRIACINAAALDQLYARSAYDPFCASFINTAERDLISRHIARESQNVLDSLGYDELSNGSSKSSSKGYVLRPASSRIVIVPTGTPYNFAAIRNTLRDESPPVIPKPLFGVGHSRDVFLLKSMYDRDRFIDAIASQSVPYTLGQERGVSSCEFNTARRERKNKDERKDRAA